MAGKSKAQLEAELKLVKQAKASDGTISIINSLIRWGAIVLIVRYTYLSIATLAGEQTSSNIVISLITDFKANKWLAYLIGGSGFFYGASQARLRKNTVERLQSRIQELEKRIDPKRSSSNLLTTGETRPEDKI